MQRAENVRLGDHDPAQTDAWLRKAAVARTATLTPRSGHEELPTMHVSCLVRACTRVEKPARILPVSCLSPPMSLSPACPSLSRLLPCANGCQFLSLPCACPRAGEKTCMSVLLMPARPLPAPAPPACISTRGRERRPARLLPSLSPQSPARAQKKAQSGSSSCLVCACSVSNSTGEKKIKFQRK